MRAYHGQQAIKDHCIARINERYANNQIIQGVHWEGHKHLGIGCGLHDDDYEGYERELGIPQHLAAVQDALFAGLPSDQAIEFPRQFLHTIRVDSDLSRIWPQYALWLLWSVREFIVGEPAEVIDTFIPLYRCFIDGQVFPSEIVAISRAKWLTEKTSQLVMLATVKSIFYTPDAVRIAAHTISKHSAQQKATVWVNMRDKLLHFIATAPDYAAPQNL